VFYGDDFTGSTDALAQYHRHGLRSILLLQQPTPARLAELARSYDVIGIAGIARSLATGAMAAEVGPALEALRTIQPRVVQYKACSTGDSSPERGSLGRAIEIGRDVFGAKPVPVLIAQPELGRYTAFGHHFAAENGEIHRLDRQPTMSRHPVTPMTEADLRIHLRRQTSLPVASLDLRAYEWSSEQALAHYQDVLARRPGAVVFDAVTQRHVEQATTLMLAAGGGDGSPVFTLGSGGLSQGLAMQLRRGHESARVAAPDSTNPDSANGGPVLVVSGSCSPRTAEQVRWVGDRGWICVPVDVDDTDISARARRRLRDHVLGALATRPPGVVVSTAQRPRTAHATELLPAIGSVLADVVRTAVSEAGVRHVIVAGGDTSGRVVRWLGASAAEVAQVLGPGAVVCRLHAIEPALQQTRLLLKGGQVGEVDLFERMRGQDESPGTTG
jgi:uncharacterized protein YgbK (DUF1537 family)